MWAELNIKFSLLFANWYKENYDSSCVEYLAESLASFSEDCGFSGDLRLLSVSIFSFCAGCNIYGCLRDFNLFSLKRAKK